MGIKNMSNNGERLPGAAIFDKQGSLLSKTNIFEYRYLLLFFVTLFGMMLRFYGLGRESIWLDEGTSIRIARQSLSDIIFVKNDFAHPPLFNVFLHLSLLINDSEFFARLPSAIFGTLSIPLTYLVGKSIFGKKEGLLSSFLLAVSVMHINYSQEGRSYALMLLLVLLTVYLFIRAYKENSKVMWLSSAISGTVLVYTHFFGFFVIGAIGLFYILDNFDFKEKKFKTTLFNKAFLVSMGVFFLLSFPIIIWVLGELGYATGHKTWGMAQDGFFYNIFMNFSNYSNTLLMLYILLMLAGLFFCLKDSKKWFSLISLWLFFPLIAGYFLSDTMPFQPRYLLFIMPAFLILISKGIVSIACIGTSIISSSSSGNKNKKKSSRSNIKSKSNSAEIKCIYAVSLIVLIISIFAYSPLYSYYTTVHKNDWRSTADYLSDVTQQGDSVMTLPGYMGDALTYYYTNSSDDTFYDNAVYSEEELTSYVQGKQRVWFLVTWDISAANPDGSAVNWLDKNAVFVKNITGIYIFTYPSL